MLTRARRIGRISVERARWLYYRAVLTRAHPSARIKGPLSVRNEGTITLGQGAILDSTRAWPIILDAVQGAAIEIGRDAYINRGCVIAGREHITIGRGAAIAEQCIIYDTDWHPLPDAPDHARIPTAPVVIGAGAWIGARCIILKGVTIGECAVVGAGSVVTKDVPPRVIAAGNPLRILRGFSLEKIKT